MRMALNMVAPVTVHWTRSRASRPGPQVRRSPASRACENAPGGPPGMRTRRVLVTRFGGPEAIEVEDAELAEPGPGEVQLRVLASGVAFGDVLKRRGLIPGVKAPFTPGYDLTGEVARMGPGASHFRPGDRVCAFVMNGGN